MGMNNTYTAPKSFLAQRLVNDYVLKADGYEFAVLQHSEGKLFLTASSSTFADEAGLDRDPVWCWNNRADLDAMLAFCKAAYLRADRYDWQEQQDWNAMVEAERQAWSNKYEQDEEARAEM